MNLHKPFLVLLTACTFTVQAVSAVSTQESQAKQGELRELRSQLVKLKKSLAANESQKAEASDALQDSERAISEANRVLAGLSEERELTASELVVLEKNIANSRVGIRKSQERLAGLIRTRYKAGQIEAWRLILNQQDPNQVSRELTYYRYISQAQLDLAHKLEMQLAELNRLADEIRHKNEILQRIAREKQKLKNQLLEDQQEKAQLLAKLSKQIRTQRSQLQQLQDDEKRMSSLLARLNELLRQQEAARVKQRAQQKLQQEKLARQNAAKQDAKSAAQPATPAAPPARINAELPDESYSGIAFAGLKGKLRLPLRGEIVGKYGATRSEGATWKGVFIRSSVGQSVKAVAGGKVIFSDWLRGFGNLLILDHGDGYMSIYGANESLLKQSGEKVAAGESIATSGNSGGMGDSGVYFELRQNGKPLDPMSWVGS